MTRPKHAAESIRRAVQDVFDRSPVPPTTEDVAAAVLRAVGDEISVSGHPMRVRVMRELLAIAAELGGQP